MRGPSAPAEAPLGRGMNLEIRIEGLDALLERASAGGISRFREPEEVSYRAGDAWLGQRQAILMDPDGYLLRFCESLGRRAEPGAGRIVG